MGQSRLDLCIVRGELKTGFARGARKHFDFLEDVLQKFMSLGDTGVIPRSEKQDVFRVGLPRWRIAPLCPRGDFLFYRFEPWHGNVEGRQGRAPEITTRVPATEPRNRRDTHGLFSE